MQNTHYLDLSDVTPKVKKVKVNIAGESREFTVTDPKTSSVIAAQYLRQEIFDFENKKAKRQIDLRDYFEMLVNQVYSVLSLENEVTRDEVKGLGLSTLNKLMNFLVSEEEGEAFLEDRPPLTPAQEGSLVSRLVNKLRTKKRTK